MGQTKITKKDITKNLFLFGTAHALIDAISITLVYRSFVTEFSVESVLYVVIFYNFLAFAIQPLFGALVDRFRSPYQAVYISFAVAAAGLGLFWLSPIVAIVCIAMSNALFHIGGGTISLNLTPKQATAPGIFVAPGAAGVLVGVLLGKSGVTFEPVFLVLLAAAAVCVYTIKKVPIDYHREEKVYANSPFVYIIILALVSVGIRALVGGFLSYEWKASLVWLVLLTIGVVVGKGLGGYLADRFGWMRIGVGSLVISIPLLLLGGNVAVVGILGMMLFNMIMPITLVLLSNALPGQPGLAFGLNCLALILGLSPLYLSASSSITGYVYVIIPIILVSAAALYLALRSYNKRLIQYSN